MVKKSHDKFLYLMKDLLEQIKSLRILVIGDVMLDRYLIGEVSRISPEAPVPVLAVMKIF